MSLLAQPTETETGPGQTIPHIPKSQRHLLYVKWRDYPFAVQSAWMCHSMVKQSTTTILGLLVLKG